ncbi:MAG: (2Fe-2S)-binding protein [Eubacteriales bacterium]|nr:(2Fe-2S)-binding protein [Eubacteriales bacterium]
MAVDRVICTRNNVTYSSLRKAMCTGVRTIDELTKATGVCNECDGCKTEIIAILASVCGCRNVLLEDVINAVNSGADTVDKVGLISGAGLDCGRCKVLIQNIIDLGY